MGKGDIKSRKGKINKSSYGNARPKPNRKAAYVKPTAEAIKAAEEAKAKAEAEKAADA